MNDGWNARLKECRERSNYTLRDLESQMKLGISQQSLIKYEKGEIFPRINVLEDMCRLYNTSIEYILYGDSQAAMLSDKDSHLVSIFMLLYSGKLTFQKDFSSLKIENKKLLSQVKALEYYRQEEEITNIEDLEKLIRGIKQIESE